MSENPTTNNPGVPATEPSAEDKVSIGRAELEALQLKEKRIDDLDTIAGQAEMGSIEDYNAELELIANDKLNTSTPEPTPTPTPTPDPIPAVTPTVAAMSDAERQSLVDADKRSTQAMLASHDTQWQMKQNLLQEEQKTVAQKGDLDKIILRKPTAIRELMPDYEGNVYAAANALFMASPDGQKKIQEHAAAIAKAKSEAGAGANLPTGGTTPAPDGQTPEDKAKKQMEDWANDIAPDSAVYGADNWK